MSLYYHLVPGMPFLLFDAVAPSAGLESQAVGIPKAPNSSDLGRRITWKTKFATAPSVVDISLQGAFRDVDAEYANIDSSTVVGVDGEYRTVLVAFSIVRARINSFTGGTEFTVEISL